MCGGQNERWHGGSLLCQRSTGPGSAGWHILLKRMLCTQVPARESEASLGEDQGLGKFPRSRCPIWWTYLYFGDGQDSCEFCQKQCCGKLDSEKRDWVVGNCALLRAPGYVSWGLFISQEIFPIQPCLPRGSLSIHFPLQIPSDAVSDGPIFIFPQCPPGVTHTVEASIPWTRAA